MGLKTFGVDGDQMSLKAMAALHAQPRVQLSRLPGPSTTGLDSRCLAAAPAAPLLLPHSTHSDGTARSSKPKSTVSAALAALAPPWPP